VTTSYVALLRGINVGGRAKVAMDDLRKVFVGLGHTEAKTYIQSGNVIFRAPTADVSQLVGDIERRIAQDLGMTLTVLLRTEAELAQVMADNPFVRSGADESKLHVTFLVDIPEGQRASGLETPAREPDQLSLVGREVYLYSPNGYGRTKLNNAFIEKRLGLAATTRGWKTVTKLRELAASA
jgi:uncharacterized protein (DUF1697 family)